MNPTRPLSADARGRDARIRPEPSPAAPEAVPDAPEIPPEHRDDDAHVPSRVKGRSRYIALIPAVGLFAAAAVLSVAVLMAVVFSTVEFAQSHIGLKALAVDFLKYADMFLLGVALYILALGLVELFVTDRIELPTWLTFRDFDALKRRLIGVIVVMLGVYFLGVVMESELNINVLWLGLSTAAVIVALGFFTREVFKK